MQRPFTRPPAKKVSKPVKPHGGPGPKPPAKHPVRSPTPNRRGG
jgi:hypothetical protein